MCMPKTAVNEEGPFCRPIDDVGSTWQPLCFHPISKTAFVQNLPYVQFLWRRPLPDTRHQLRSLHCCGESRTRFLHSHLIPVAESIHKYKIHKEKASQKVTLDLIFWPERTRVDQEPKTSTSIAFSRKPSLLQKVASTTRKDSIRLFGQPPIFPVKKLCHLLPTKPNFLLRFESPNPKLQLSKSISWRNS